MGLDIPINLDLIDSSTDASPTKTPYIDWDSGRIYGFVDRLEAMKQHIKKTLSTERFKFLIYDNQYGTETDNLKREDLNLELFELEATRIVQDALLCDKRITSVYDFDFTQSSDEKVIRFSVDTIYGSLTGQEVKINV